MTEPLFRGTCTALVTPFQKGKVNYEMLKQLLLRQILAGIEAVVLFGTTGESATLSDDEKIEIIRQAKDCTCGKCLILAGTGSNCTAHAVALGKAAEEAGADALLVVSPYYNKATPEGLIDHYTAIAQSVHIPVIVYNVPSRTGLDVPVEVYEALSHVANIAGVKEASTDVKKIGQILLRCPETFYVWSGNADLTVPIMALVGVGVISVGANVWPQKYAAMTDAAQAGNYIRAAAIQKSLIPLTDLLFREVSPIPVKAAMGHLGLDCGLCRPPLSPVSAELDKALETLLNGT